MTEYYKIYQTVERLYEEYLQSQLSKVSFRAFRGSCLNLNPFPFTDLINQGLPHRFEVAIHISLIG